MRYLRIALHFRHFIRFQTYTRARWVRKLWQYCFKIENRTSTQTNFQTTDTRKLSCVFLSSFSARQCKQTYAIFLRFVDGNGFENTSKITKKNIQGMIETIPFSISFYNLFNCSFLRFSSTIYSRRNLQSSPHFHNPADQICYPEYNSEVSAMRLLTGKFNLFTSHMLY